MASGILYQGSLVTTVIYTPGSDAKVRVIVAILPGVALTTLCSLNGTPIVWTNVLQTSGAISAAATVDLWVAAGSVNTFLTTANGTTITVLESQ